MIARIKKFLGLHSHKWALWQHIRASDLTIVGRRRRCVYCPKVQEEHYPDGH